MNTVLLFFSRFPPHIFPPCIFCPPRERFYNYIITLYRVTRCVSATKAPPSLPEFQANYHVARPSSTFSHFYIIPRHRFIFSGFFSLPHSVLFFLYLRVVSLVPSLSIILRYDNIITRTTFLFFSPRSFFAGSDLRVVAQKFIFTFLSHIWYFQGRVAPEMGCKNCL